MKTKQLLMNSLYLALLIISGFIKIPFVLIPFTLQTLIVLIIILICSFKDSISIILIYLVLGLIGLPVFTSGGGLGYVLLPSFGFLVGFLVASVTSILFKKIKINNQNINNLIISVLSLLVIYIVGLVYGYFIIAKTLKYAFEVLVLPFILIDIFKALVASIIVTRLKKINN